MLNRNKSTAHPKDYLAKEDKEYLQRAFIDLKWLDLRAFKNFIMDRRQAICEELEEITGIKKIDLSDLLETASDEEA